MKPIKLTIYGIGSYTSVQTIDFEKLSQNNLFGVFGETGSGKSTVLDSLVLSLFGSSDRGKVESIINIGMSEAYVILEFESRKDNVATGYKIKRSFQKIDGQIYGLAELTNLTTNSMVANSITEVSAAIETIIGMTRKEFLKCVSLPQNKFDTFIMDNPEERKRSIAKIFNLENFGDKIIGKVRERESALVNDQLAITNQLSMFNNIDEENHNVKKAELELLQQHVKKLQEQSEQLSSQVDGMEEAYLKTTKYQHAYQDYTDLAEQKDEFEKLKYDLQLYVDNKDNLDNYNNLQKVRAEHNDLVLKLDVYNQSLQSQQSVKVNLQARYDEVVNQINQMIKLQQEFSLSIEKKKFLTKEIDVMAVSVRDLQDVFDEQVGNLEVFKEQGSQIESQLSSANAELLLVREQLSKFNQSFVRAGSMQEVKDCKKTLDVLYDLQSQINIDDLQEISMTVVYRGVNSLMHKLTGYIAEYNTQMLSSNGQNNEAALVIEDIEKSIVDLEKQEKVLCVHVEELQSMKIEITSEVKSLLVLTKKAESDLLVNREKLDKAQSVVDKLQNIVDYSQDIVLLQNERDTIELQLNELTNSIAECSGELRSLKVQYDHVRSLFNELTILVPENFSLNVFDEINESNFAEKNQMVMQYFTRLNYFKNLCASIQLELDGSAIDTTEYNAKKELARQLAEHFNQKFVELKMLQKEVLNNEGNLMLVTEMRNELVGVESQLTLVRQLLSLLDKNALIEFVAEEYLQIICSYANKFVYATSRGKYSLKYSSKNEGEFVVVDNFNGSIERGIKTLSGGEKFIFSLSTALGISQCIAASRNQTVKFFFIDEGFGNLSTDYIDDVLQCLTMLARLDFTVGFISHVEKMQEVIVNKVIVTKQDNIKGSVIEHFY